MDDEKGLGLLRSISRRKFILSGILVTLSAIVSCRPKSEQAITPEVNLSELIDHPDLYTGLTELKTRGYPEATGTKIASYPLITYSGNNMHLTWVTMKVNSYNLHTVPEQGSPAIELTVSGGTVLFPTALEPSGSNLLQSAAYEVTGAVSKIREADNREHFVLKASSAVEVQAVP